MSLPVCSHCDRLMKSNRERCFIHYLNGVMVISHTMLCDTCTKQAEGKVKGKLRWIPGKPEPEREER